VKACICVRMCILYIYIYIYIYIFTAFLHSRLLSSMCSDIVRMLTYSYKFIACFPYRAFIVDVRRDRRAVHLFIHAYIHALHVYMQGFYRPCAQRSSDCSFIHTHIRALILNVLRDRQNVHVYMHTYIHALHIYVQGFYRQRAQR
jgi:hypothetical protein